MSTATAKRMCAFSELKPGTVLSETQYYKVEKLAGNKVQLRNDGGEPIVVDINYVETLLTTADQFLEEKKVTKTEATQIFLAHPFTAMTVNFNKQVKKADIVKEIQDAYENSTPKEFTAKVSKAVGKSLEGEERTMVGRHAANQDEFGRIHFIDMNIDKTADSYDNRQRLVDPRTINWVIVKGVKYIVK